MQNGMGGKEELMEFRPCIDIHNGKVKQLIGGSVADLSDQAQENFVSGKPAVSVKLMVIS